MSSKLTLKPYTYFYGYSLEQVKALAETPYREALETKVKDGKELLVRLVAIPFLQQDTARITDVSKAIEFNTNLLGELQ